MERRCVLSLEGEGSRKDLEVLRPAVSKLTLLLLRPELKLLALLLWCRLICFKLLLRCRSLGVLRARLRKVSSVECSSLQFALLSDVLAAASLSIFSFSLFFSSFSSSSSSFKGLGLLKVCRFGELLCPRMFVLLLDCTRSCCDLSKVGSKTSSVLLWSSSSSKSCDISRLVSVSSSRLMRMEGRVSLVVRGLVADALVRSSLVKGRLVEGSLVEVDLMGVCLVGVCLVGVCLVGVCLVGVCLVEGSEDSVAELSDDFCLEREGL